MAIGVTTLPVMVQGLCCAATLALAYHRIRQSRTPATLEHDDVNGLWRFFSHGEFSNKSATKGTLVHAGYRSALVVVLTIQTDRLDCQRIAIWHDQVPDPVFSYLHFQLQFNTAAKERRTLRAFFGGIAKVAKPRRQ